MLIVEDDRVARKAIALILKRRGFAVWEAATVQEAMCELSREPQWMLLDLMLPDGCGVDVLRHVRSNGAPTRVCIITGGGPDLLDEGKRAGAEHAFTKPLDVDQLISVMCD